MSPYATYEEKKRKLIDEMRGQEGALRLSKDTSNLFRNRQTTPARRLNVRDFTGVLAVDAAHGTVEAEGMTPYETLVDECLRQGVMPAVVPQLKSITLGGAATGCGIEASSFRYGLVHETLQEMEVLLPEGRTVVATPTNEHRDLFFGFPNSYGTLGYALRLKAKVIPVKKYVRLTHVRHHTPEEFFSDLKARCERADVDFVDGVIFSPTEMVVTLGRFTDEALYTSDYTYAKIYYRSLRSRTEDFLATRDFIWRWDTDWFWCSKNLGMQNPLVRMLVGPKRLNSVTYTKVMRWNAKWKLTEWLNKLSGIHAESVIQDVEVPIDRATEFFKFYFDTVRFTPVWTCPTRAYDKNARFDLYRMDPNVLYVNFGFWDVIRGREKLPSGFYNRQVEEKVMELRGMKSLYSDSFYSEEEFWRLYNQPAYEALKKKNDPK